MPADAQLGSFVLSKNDLNLFLALSITVDEAASDLTSSKPASHILEHILAQRPWITRGSGLHLAFDILTDQDPVTANAVTAFARSVCSAELWTQLHLEASLLSDVSRLSSVKDGQASICFKIGLRHLLDVPHNAQQLRHRMLKDVPFADIKPPTGVGTMTLIAVNLTMAIASTLGHTPAAHSTVPQPTKRRKGPIARHDSAVDVEGGGMSDGEDLFARDVNCARIAVREVPARDGTAPPADTGASKSAAVPAEASIAAPHVTAMLDYAFRVSLHGKSVKNAFGIKIKKNSLAAGLVNIAPSLWSPGYQKAVAERSCFLPTLAHALSSVKRSSHNDSADVHQVKLFQRLQTALYDGKAARVLKPISVSSVGNQAAPPETMVPALLCQSSSQTNIEQAHEDGGESLHRDVYMADFEDWMIEDSDESDILDDATASDVDLLFEANHDKFSDEADLLMHESWI